MFKTILANFHLEKIFWIIKSKMLYMILCALVMAAVVGGYGYLTKSSTYRAEISFYAYSNPDYITDSDVNQSANEITQARNLLASYMQILLSDTFLNSVIEHIDYDVTPAYLRSCMGSTAVENTAVFAVDVYNANPVFATDVANAIGELAPAEIIRIVKSGGIEILDPATLPTTPYQSTSVVKLAVIGGLLGFVLSAMVFMLKGLLDTTVRRKYEIEDMFNIPILGTVPAMVPQKKGEVVEKQLSEESPFAIREAYSDIRANMLFVGKGEKCPVFGITSADTHEGKSMNALNLSIAFASLGKKVLFIDADMRKSALRKTLKLEGDSKHGLSQYLACITEAIDVEHYMENLDIIPSGELPPNPSELLISERWKNLLLDSKDVYDVIFIDLPPVGIVSDALTVVNEVTSFILIIREKVTKFERSEMIVRKLESLDANISGFIYNGISVKSPDYNYKAYGKDYQY